MLDSNLLEQFKNFMLNLKSDVEIVSFAKDDKDSKDMLSFLDKVSSVSDKIEHIQSKDINMQRIPSFQIRRKNEDTGVFFAGLPLGHEFTSFVLALLHVSKHPPKISDDIIEKIKEIKDELVFETYYSLSCQNCPDVIQSLNIIASLNANVKHIAIEGSTFQQEVEDRQVMAVPSVFLNGEVFTQGRQDISQILDKINPVSTQEQIQKIKSFGTFDTLTIGAGPAGVSSAIYSARKGIKTGLITDKIGGQVLDTMSIENFISIPHTTGPQLALSLEEHLKEYGVDVIKPFFASSIKKEEDLFKVYFENGTSLSSKSIILSPGARWRNLGVEGEEDYKNKGVTYCPHCDGPLFKNKKVAVIGGGNSGVEAAIDLAGIVDFVYLLEFDNKLRADKVLQDKLNSLSNTKVILNAQTTQIKGDGNKVTSIEYKDREDEQIKSLDIEGVFVQIGLLPNTEWLKGFVDLNSRGEIIIDDKGQTSIPGVFAAGDATTVAHKQIVVALGAGASASLSAFDYLIRR